VSIKYKKKDWVVMTEDNITQFDNLSLPTFEKVTLTIMRRFSEDERKKCHESRMKFGRGIPIKYEELLRKLR
jgi:hypothetical protein